MSPRTLSPCEESRADQRDDLVADVIGPLGATDVATIRSISAKAGYALKAAANVPYLLRMAAELIWRGFDIHGRAQMYTVFTQDIALRKGSGVSTILPPRARNGVW